jgi:beta-aspartyl-peptidase (threonine type)
VDSIALVVHGGAGTIRPEIQDDCRSGLKRALERGWAVLEAGGSSLDACEQAIIQLEDEPVFDAGVGAHLNKDGQVQLDAIIMDGVSLNSGAVGAVERIRNPIRLARLLFENNDHMFLVGSGAERFAAERGIPFCDPRDFITPYELERWKTASLQPKVPSYGTVGAVARDRAGNIAAGTSTGGTFFKYPGRIGDSPLIGCGCYADNWSAAVSCTGHGESIMKVVMAKLAADYVAMGQSPQSAAEKAIEVLSRRTTGHGGLIMLDRHGQPGVAFSTRHMSWASRSLEGTKVSDFS